MIRFSRDVNSGRLLVWPLRPPPPGVDFKLYMQIYPEEYLYLYSSLNIQEKSVTWMTGNDTWRKACVLITCYMTLVCYSCAICPEQVGHFLHVMRWWPEIIWLGCRGCCFLSPTRRNRFGAFDLVWSCLARPARSDLALSSSRQVCFRCSLVWFYYLKGKFN